LNVRLLQIDLKRPIKNMTERSDFHKYSIFNIDESVKSQNQTVLKKVQIQGVQILQS